ncbi:zwei Ig domain protein zig-8-like isoform X1 [Babylonia areolata]|uniref:zwei Ig domain protein zig-8-like isoform X1 n=1 Tax=Babylonia areolata TaxID=304850 RepID=UPI003FD5BB8F
MNVTVNIGDIATLPCMVQNLGTRGVSWRRAGSEHFLTIGATTWVQDGNLVLEHAEWPGGLSEWNLVIKEARPKDAGTYECQIIHTDTIKWEVTLTVEEKAVYRPGKSPLPSLDSHGDGETGGQWPAISLEGKEFVESGDRIRLVCNSTEGSRVPEDVDWFKNGDKISSEQFPHVLMTKFRAKESHSLISELIIERAKSRDSGTYICRSSLEQIASLEVTVLVAGSTNIKRGSGSSQTARPHLHGENCAVTFSVILGNRCVVIVLMALTYMLTFNLVTT